MAKNRRGHNAAKPGSGEVGFQPRRLGKKPPPKGAKVTVVETHAEESHAKKKEVASIYTEFASSLERRKGKTRLGFRSRKGRAIAATGVASLAMALTACSTGATETVDADYAGVCVDQQTQQRVPDDKCPPLDKAPAQASPGNTMVWYYLMRGRMVPAMGAKVSGGTYYNPGSQKVVSSGFAEKGGPVAREGFTRSGVVTGKGYGGYGKGGSVHGGFGNSGGARGVHVGG